MISEEHVLSCFDRAETDPARSGDEGFVLHNPCKRGIPLLPTCLVASCTLVEMRLLLFVGCLTSQQHACVSQGRICSDNFTCCHTKTEAADHILPRPVTAY